MLRLAFWIILIAWASFTLITIYKMYRLKHNDENIKKGNYSFAYFLIAIMLALLILAVWYVFLYAFASFS